MLLKRGINGGMSLTDLIIIKQGVILELFRGIKRNSKAGPHMNTDLEIGISPTFYREKVSSKPEFTKENWSY